MDGLLIAAVSDGQDKVPVLPVLPGHMLCTFQLACKSVKIRLVSNCWPQAILPSQPPKVLGLHSPDGSNPITFLRRANRIDLGAIPDPDVSSVLADTAKIANFSWWENR